MQLLKLAALHREWLAHKQTIIADNLANANTPGYSARAIVEFEKALHGPGLAPATTHESHLTLSKGQSLRLTEESLSSSVSHSGNSVNVETQLLEAGNVRASYSLNTSITKTFHRMMLASTRG